ncbi:unnamed protein product [Paramecium pentaurelia]|uniref:Uncharacterized protein n=1 Tax=Paramecium pentaurelia TaxID=43138 RepID=A0A8S1S609_9CILI|nr:unnamed protein product [Paramecium pentaurelia]
MNNQIGLNLNYNKDVELALYKKKIDLDYSKISHKFGFVNKISPVTLENYNQYHIYNKLFRNEQQRKSIQARVQTIDPKTTKYYINNSTKFFDFLKHKVQHTIKGNHYIMQLGQMPLSSRSKTPPQKTQRYQKSQTIFHQESRTEKLRFSNVQSEQNTCIEIQKACQVYQMGQKELKGIYKKLRIWIEIKIRETINL